MRQWMGREYFEKGEIVMARIPVERKKTGIPWWAWLILALLVAGLIWFLFELFSRDPNEARDLNVETGAEVAAPAGAQAEAAGGTNAGQQAGVPLTDLLIIIDAPDRASMVGKQVQLANVTVQSVVGDKTFWVGPTTDKQLFVVLEEDPSAGAVEGQVDVNAGQTVTITGEVRKLPSMEEARSQWGLSETNSAQLEQQQIYVHAQQVKIAGQ